MYIRTISRKNKDGSVVRYVQLAHNYWDSQAGHARAQVLYSFGREEDVDREGLKRLIKSIARYLGPQELLRIQTSDGEAPLKFIRSRPFVNGHLKFPTWGCGCFLGLIIWPIPGDSCTPWCFSRGIMA